MSGPARIYVAGKGWVDVNQAGMGSDFTGPIQTPAEPISGLNPLGLTNPNLPQPDPRTPEQKDQEQSGALQQFLAGLLEVGAPLALAPATGGGSALMRMAFPVALDALTGAGAGAITGEGALKEAVDNATLGAGGVLGAEYLPKIGLGMGQIMGKKIHDIGEGSKPFLEYRAKAHIGGAVPLGSAKLDTTRETPGFIKRLLTRSNDMRSPSDVAGQALTSAAEANPARLDIAQGADDVVSKLKAATTGNFPSTFPLDAQADFETLGERWKHQNLGARGKMVPEVDNAIHTTGTLVDDTRLSAARRRPLPGRPRNVKDAVPIDDGVIDIEKLGAADFHPAKDLSVNEAVNLRKSHNANSREIHTAKANNVLIPTGEKHGAEFDAAISAKLKELIDQVDNPTRDIGRAYEDNARIAQMRDVNKELRPLGLLGRAGGAYVLGTGLESVLGIDHGTIAQPLSLFASTMGTPRRLSGLGFALGHVADAAPTATRIAETGMGMSEAGKKKDVKRKEPK